MGGYLALWIIGGILVGIVGPCCCGYFTKRLNNEKGYDGGFWLGFFFGLMGLIYVAGRPEYQATKYYPQYMSNKKSDKSIGNPDNNTPTASSTNNSKSSGPVLSKKCPYCSTMNSRTSTFSTPQENRFY